MKIFLLHLFFIFSISLCCLPLCHLLLKNQKKQEIQYIFLQKKFYIHTDCLQYLAGDTLWFRIHKVNAKTHLPDITTYPLYVDLADRSNSIINRIKIIPDNGVYQGYIPIAQTASNGAHQVRCYTIPATNPDTVPAFYQHPIYIGDEKPAISLPPLTDFDVTFHPEGGI
ncbi:MAG: hypothetical protein LUD02_16130 [Tannerellaceae bacterium]|nr:hypothetical protein [Tannerellaceae bacterium]